MSKWKSKFSSLVESLKKPLGNSKGKSKKKDSEENAPRREAKTNHPAAENLVESMEWEEGEEDYQGEDYQEEDHQAEGYDEHDETNPSFSTLTLSQIKQSQLENGEATPELPPEVESELAQDDDGDYNFEEGNDFEVTSPAIREYTPKSKSSLLDKLKSNKSKFTSSNSPTSQALMEKLKNINFDEFFEKFYAPENRRKIHYIFLMLLLTGASIKTAQIISALLTPLPSTARNLAPPPASLNQLDQLNSALAQLEGNDLFRAPRKGKQPVKVAPKVKEEAICLDAKKKSNLSIKLLNTVVLQDEVKSLASVQNRKDAEYLRKGDSIPGVLEVGRISKERLFFKNLKTRECEYIENSPKGPKRSNSKIAIVKEPRKAKKILDSASKNGISNVGNQFKIKKEVRERMLENISEVLTQARAVQIKNPDGSLSFRMQEVVPGSIYSQLNIENGDVVSGINGNKIKNVSELMQLFGKIDKIDHFELTVKKKGIEQNLQYDFE